MSGRGCFYTIRLLDTVDQSSVSWWSMTFTPRANSTPRGDAITRRTRRLGLLNTHPTVPESHSGRPNASWFIAGHHCTHTHARVLTTVQIGLTGRHEQALVQMLMWDCITCCAGRKGPRTRTSQKSGDLAWRVWFFWRFPRDNGSDPLSAYRVFLRVFSK